MAPPADRRVRAHRPLLRAAGQELSRAPAGSRATTPSCRPIRGTTSSSRPTRSSSGVHFLADEKPELVAAQGAARLPVRSRGGRRRAASPTSSRCRCRAAGPSAGSQAFARGLAADQRRYGIVLCGGDTRGHAGPAHRHHHRLRPVPRGKGLTRAGARAGDELWVSGTIGDGALGLLAARGRIAEPRALEKRYRLPQPRTTLGPRLVGIASADGRCLRRPAGRRRPYRRGLAAWRRDRARSGAAVGRGAARARGRAGAVGQRAGRRRRLRTRDRRAAAQASGAAGRGARGRCAR